VRGLPEFKSRDLAILVAVPARTRSGRIARRARHLLSFYPAGPRIRRFIAGVRPLEKAGAHFRGLLDLDRHLEWPQPVPDTLRKRFSLPPGLKP
jgi:hypothetical protein